MEFHARVIKNILILDHENHNHCRIPRANHENHVNLNIPQENHKIHKNLKNLYENHAKTLKYLNSIKEL